MLDWELEEVEPQDKNNDKNWTSPLMDPIIKGGFQEILQEEHENKKVENLKDEEKTLGSKPTPGQANGITSKRVKLRDRVDAFLEKRSLYIFDVGDPDHPRLIDFVSEDGDWAEPVDLGMPSPYAYTTLADVGLSKMADLEARLRRGVCKDALESVKRQLRGKAATIRHKHMLNEISGTMAVTRAESAIQAQTTKILKTRWRYLNSRNALIQIGAPETNFDDYLDLKLSDLTPLSAFYNLYSATTGHGKTTMLWIWRSTVARNKEEWEVDALKTEWFRSRECYRRWDEQLVITKCKMVMTIRSFQSHQDILEWKSRNGQATPGMRAWACRRSRFFADLSRQMLDASLKYLRDNTVRLPWAEKWLAANVSDLFELIRTIPSP
ncbi:hypothetical protein FRC09_016008 [Ceratobasidium sp. 395]|nr:hypothetical protein FRC09_016008 [Ceratobasidium sp. 395]